MRCILPLVIPVLASILTAGPANEAEKLFRQMETTIHRAESIQCEIDTKITSHNSEMHCKGTIHLSQGNQARYEFVIKSNEREIKVWIVCDGEKVTTKMTPHEGNGKVKVAPKDFGQLCRGMLARVGSLGILQARPQEQTEQGKVRKLDDYFKARDFAIAGDEVIDNVKTKIVTCRIELANRKVLTAKHWIDTKSMRPIRREFYSVDDPDELRVVESCTSMKINPKIDPKLFKSLESTRQSQNFLR